MVHPPYGHQESSANISVVVHCLAQSPSRAPSHPPCKSQVLLLGTPWQPPPRPSLSMSASPPVTAPSQPLPSCYLNKYLKGPFLSPPCMLMPSLSLSLFLPPSPLSPQSQNPHRLECPLDTGLMSRLMQLSPNPTVSLAACTGAVYKA